MTGLTSAIVPVRNTSSAVRSSYGVMSLSLISYPSSSASLMTRALVTPWSMPAAEVGVLTMFCLMMNMNWICIRQ